MDRLVKLRQAVRSIAIVGLCCMAAVSQNAYAHEHVAHDQVGALGSDGKADNLVIVRELKGPTKTAGIESVNALGVVDLGGEFESMKGHEMRARVFTIKPGGVVARHEHQSRPGFAYIISGQIIEHRNDQKDAIVRKPGDVAIERSGVVHYWENTFKEPVVALVVDIVKTEN